MRQDEPALGGQEDGGLAGARPAAVPRARPGWIRGVSAQSGIVAAAAAAALAVVVVISLASSGPAAARRTLPVARNFTLSSLGQQGKQVSLAAFAGRPVVLNFFASWCPPCKRETPLLATFYRDWRGRVTIIGIDANDKAGPAESFVRAAGVTYPVGFDPFPASATTSYGVLGLPQTFFLDSRHRIVKRIFGDVTMTELTAGVALIDGRRPAQAAPAASGTASGPDRG